MEKMQDLKEKTDIEVLRETYPGEACDLAASRTVSEQKSKVPDIRKAIRQLQSGYPIKYKKDKKRKYHLMLSFFG